MNHPELELDIACRLCGCVDGMKCESCDYYICGYCLNNLKDGSTCPKCQTQNRRLVGDDLSIIPSDVYISVKCPPTKFQLESKYCDLVVFARMDDITVKEHNLSSVIDQFKFRYPKDTHDLETDNSNWQHGFNSGVLATLRLMKGGQIDYREWSEFPRLDT